MKPEDATPTPPPVAIRPAASQLPQGVSRRRAAPSRRGRPADPSSPPPQRPQVPVAPIAPGSNRGAHLSARELVRQRQRERELERRRRRHDIRFAAVGALLLLVAFLGGYFWPSTTRSARAQDAPPIDPARREAALAKIDDAVRAKASERLDDAAALASEARRLDPAVRGADLIAAEIAFRQQKSDVLRSATTEALRRGDNVSDALLLQGLDSWMSRGLKGQSSAEAVESAARKLDDASEGDLSNPAVWFFRGEVMREGGRVRESHRSLLAALHRQQPWLGAEFLSAKLDFAREEARRADAPAAPAADLPPAAVLRRALATGADPSSALSALAGRLTAWQTRQFLDDPALHASSIEAARETRTAAGVAVQVPGGGLAAAQETPPTP